MVEGLWSAEELVELAKSTEQLDDSEYAMVEQAGRQAEQTMEQLEVLSQRPSSEPSKPKKAKLPSKKEREFEIKTMICRNVRKYPAIYQITHKDFSNKVAKDAMWEKISRAVSSDIGRNVTVPECRKYWDALRESTRVYLDRSKLAKIREKSGAPADLVDLYNSNTSDTFDLYQNRWPFAEEMSFYIPSCARTAYTVSLGNSASNTRLKPSNETQRAADFEGAEWSEEFDNTSRSSTEQTSYASSVSPSTSRQSSRPRKGDDANIDMTLMSLASSVSDFVNARTSQKEFKFKEFHNELDDILRELPVIEAMKFNISVLEQANELLKQYRSQQD